ncbi:MAG TPA: hypothetical protein VFN57_07330 [Thermomicrobiaceae bacterium]|nr:hypothetical protein [Thermomicrobiaceae bacterium]
MNDRPERLLNADEQIAEVRASLARLKSEPASPARDQELRDAQDYLDQLLAMRARGELEPLARDTTSPL